MISAGIAIFGRLCIFGLLTSAGLAWMLAAECLAVELARERHDWTAAALLVVSAIGLALTALAFWPTEPVPLPALLARLLTPA